MAQVETDLQTVFIEEIQFFKKFLPVFRIVPLDQIEGSGIDHIESGFGMAFQVLVIGRIGPKNGFPST